MIDSHAVLEIESEYCSLVEEHGVEHIKIAAIQIPATRVGVFYLDSFEINVKFLRPLANNGLDGEIGTGRNYKYSGYESENADRRCCK